MDDLISRQAAIDEANAWLLDCFHVQKQDRSCGLIRRLEDLPSAQSEYRLDEWCTDCKEYDHERHCCPRWNRVIRDTLQDAQVERKNGRWLTSDDMYETGVCSVCKWDSEEPVSYTITMFKYCPNCGANMRGEENETN